MPSKPKYVKNPKTGVVFPATEILLKNNKHLVPCDKEGKSAFDEIDDDDLDETEGGSLDLDDQNPGDANEAGDGENGLSPDFVESATKAELITFAKDNFGEEIPVRTGADEVRAKVRELIENA